MSADPGDRDARLLSARLHRRIAEDISLHGGEAGDHLNQAVADATAVVEGRDASPAQRLELVRVHLQYGESVLERGRDPAPHLRAAAEILDRFTEPEQDYETLMQAGLIAHPWADYQDQVGQDSAAQRARSITAYQAATAADGNQVPAWINLGTCLLADAKRPGVVDPDGQLDKARRALDRARALDPKHLFAYLFSGGVLSEIAERTKRRGGDPRPEMERALQLYLDGAATKNNQPQLPNSAGTQRILLADEAWDRGASPHPLLEAARRDFTNAIDAAPGQGWAYVNLCESWIAAALYHSRAGEDPTEWVQYALADGRKAAERMSDYATVWSDIAEAHLALAEFEAGHGVSPIQRTRLALSAVTNAWQRNTAEPGAARANARALALVAGWEARQGHPAAAAFEQAVSAFQRAVTLAPGDQSTQVLMGHCCREWARAIREEHHDPAPALAQAAQIADVLVQARPEWGEALALRGSIWLGAAQADLESISRKEKAAKAWQFLTNALTRNPHLQPQWRPVASTAQVLMDGESSR